MSDPISQQERLRRRVEASAVGERRGGAGAAFPTGIAAGFRWFRTDLGLDFAYDGTYWLSQELEANCTHYTATTVPFTGAAGVLLISPARTDYDYYITYAKIYCDVVATNNGANYWTMALKQNGGGSATVWSFNTSADSAGAGINKSNAPATLYSGTQYFYYEVTSKTGAPGALRFNGTFWYRLRMT